MTSLALLNRLSTLTLPGNVQPVISPESAVGEIFRYQLVGPPGSGAFEGAVQHVRNFGPVQRAEVALFGGETIEIDAPRDKELRVGDRVGLEPRRYRIFAG